MEYQRWAASTALVLERPRAVRPFALRRARLTPSGKDEFDDEYERGHATETERARWRALLFGEGQQVAEWAWHGQPPDLGVVPRVEGPRVAAPAPRDPGGELLGGDRKAACDTRRGCGSKTPRESADWLT